MHAIELQDISYTYEGATSKALRGVDFFMEYGELALLSGLSGSGKSTLLHIISGIIPNLIKGRLCGSVKIEGKAMQDMTMGSICRKVGVVLQNADAQIIYNIVEDEIAFGCQNIGFDSNAIRQNMERACQDMQLNPAWETRTLSGGQKQKLITASVLAMCPKILILDEPLANLDMQAAVLLLRKLRALAEQGYAVLIIEHRLDTVMQYVDRVWHIEDGVLYRVLDRKRYLEANAQSIEDPLPIYEGGACLFRLDAVSYGCKQRKILHGIDMQIERGSRTLLLGNNGSGKTTLTRILSRLIRPTSGQVQQYIDASFGKRRASRKWFRNVGVIYQNPNYQLFMPTVKKELEFGATSKQFAMEVAKRFEIEHLLERHPQSLSEGQKRLVTIASVLAGNPQVLILDEPTVGQDYASLQRLTRILNNFHAEYQNTMITVTHDIRCAQALCDRATVLQDGHIIASGGKQLVQDFWGALAKGRVE